MKRRRFLGLRLIPLLCKGQSSNSSTVELSQANIALRLQQLKGGTADVVVQEPIYLHPLGGAAVVGAADEWEVRNISFRPGAVIYIGTTNLSLGVEGDLIPGSNYAVIFAAFGPKDAKAGQQQPSAGGGLGPTSPTPGSSGGQGGRGQDGKPGENGKKAGNLFLRLRREPKLSFGVSLKGQDGGDGGDGGNGGAGRYRANRSPRRLRPLRVQPGRG